LLSLTARLGELVEVGGREVAESLAGLDEHARRDL
jgi:hypothetical protein